MFGWTAAGWWRIHTGVIRLNDQLEVTAEFTTPLPATLRVDGQGLWVGSVDGLTLLDGYLRPVRRAPVELERLPTELRQVDPEAVLTDPDTGITWACEGEWLHQVSQGGDSRSVYVGTVHRGTARARLIPYRDEILLLFDDRAHLFGRDGRWRRVIRFERVSVDYIYYVSTHGENSWHLDDETGKLYLVQGQRVLEIDLNSGAVATVFEQEGCNFGTLLHRDRRLYMTATVDREYRGGLRGTEYTEILVYDIGSGRLARWLISEVYNSEEITGDGSLYLWMFDGPAQYGNSGRYALVNPGMLTVPDWSGTNR